MPIWPMKPDGVSGGPKPVTPTPVSVPRPAPPQQTAPISTNSSGRYAQPIAPPREQAGAVPDINAFLTGDTGYQQQLRQYAQALAAFQADATRRQGSLESEYGLSTKALGDQRVKDLESLKDDFGARGLLRSGLYGDSVGDYETEYNQRVADLARRQQEALTSLTNETNQFKTQQQLQEQAAREAAIARRAASLGI